MPLRVLHDFVKRFGAPIYEGYGLTETTVSVASNTVCAKKVGSVGRPYRGVDIKIVDDQGREVPRGEYVFMSELPKGASGKILKRELRAPTNRQN